MRHQRRDSLFSETVSGFPKLLYWPQRRRTRREHELSPLGRIHRQPASPPAVMARFRRGVGVAREGGSELAQGGEQTSIRNSDHSSGSWLALKEGWSQLLARAERP